jgi:polysaccharide chain length determinant protein (PEP-CTERM system associated)
MSDLTAILKQRHRPAIAVGLTVLLGFVALSYGLPAVYESTARLLIEQSDLPAALQGRVGGTNTVERRLQTVSQRVMTASNIESLIGSLGLYDQDKDADVPEELIRRFRESTLVVPSTAETVNAESLRTAEMTYGFNVTFRYSDPEKTQAVAASIAKIFVDAGHEEARLSVERAVGLLRTEADRLEKDLRETENQLAEFKQRHAGALPDSRDDTMRRAESAERDLIRIEEDLRSAREQQQLLLARMADTPKYSAVLDVSGKPVQGTDERLAAAQQQLIAALAKYSEDHPDVRNLRREIATMTQEGGARSSGPNNPTYLQLQAQLNSTEASIRELSARRAELMFVRGQGQHAAAASPLVERDYSNLLRDYELKQTQYREMRRQQTEAELAQKAGAGQSGERYTIVESPPVPTSPVEPDRISLMLLGLILAVASTIATAAALHTLDTTVRGSADVLSITGNIPLGTIPNLSR